MADELKPRTKIASRDDAGVSFAASAQKLSPILLISVGLVTYRNSLHGPFIFDDLSSIPHNPTIRRLLPPWDVLAPPPYRTVGGRPIVNLSLGINYALGGLDVWGYHALNLALHFLAALTLLGIVRRTLLGPGLRPRYGEAAPWLAMTVALLWMVHPLLTESVNYIIQRTELLMGLFLLLTLYCLIRGAEAARPRRWYVAAVVACALGMGSKEVMVVAPVVVLLYDRAFLEPSFREVFRRRGALHAGLATTWLLLATLMTTNPHKMTGLGFARLTPWDYARTELGVLVYYLRLSLWPSPLVLDYYDWPVASTVASVVPPAIAVAGLLGATLWAFRRCPPLGFLGAWFFLILAPTSSVLPNLGQVAAERRMYLPLAAVIVLVVMGTHAAVDRLLRHLRANDRLRRGLEGALVVVTLATLGSTTLRRNEDYRSAFSIWSDVVAKRPNNARGHNNLGEVCLLQGQLEEARDHFSEAVRLQPDLPLARYNLGTVLAAQGQIGEALAQLAEALRLKPDYVDAHVNMGVLLHRQGQLGEAIHQYAEALRLEPTHVEAHYSIGLALAQQERTEEARQHFKTVLELDPGHQGARLALEDLKNRISRGPVTP